MAVLIDLKENFRINSSAANLYSAAKKLSKDFSVIISSFQKDDGELIENVLKVNKFPKDVNKVIISCNESGTAEGLEIIESEQQKFDFTHLLALNDSFGKDCLPRLAAKISESILITDVLKIDGDSQSFERPIYAGNAIAKIEISEEARKLPQFISIRSTAFSASDAGELVEKDKVDVDVEVIKSLAKKKSHSRVLKREMIKSARPELGPSAKIVVSGGRALKSSENFEKLIYPLADVLGAAVGASRAAVDAGFVPNDLQVGQTGKIVAPQLYWAIGISGAIQHVAGMKDSKVIVAINKDPDCPIFQIADYGLIGDLFEIIPELTEKLKNK